MIPSKMQIIKCLSCCRNRGAKTGSLLFPCVALSGPHLSCVPLLCLFGCVNNLLSFICSFTWGIWGGCSGVLPPSCSCTLGNPCLLAPSWSCKVSLAASWASSRWELRVVPGTCMLWALQGLKRFTVWLNRIARVGDTFFLDFYCELFRWCPGFGWGRASEWLCGPSYQLPG